MELVLLFAVLLFPISFSYAVDFEDETGYIPKWAPEMDDAGIHEACKNVVDQTPDFYWCVEHQGFISSENTEAGTGKFDSQLFPDSNDFSRYTYVNQQYKFFIEPPSGWSMLETEKNIGIKNAVVAFYSDNISSAYKPNFVVTYQKSDSGVVNYYRNLSDDEFLKDAIAGFFMGSIDPVRVVEKELERHTDGFKIRMQYGIALLLGENQAAILKAESIGYILDNGDTYILTFSSMPDEFDSNIVPFQMSAKTFHVGEIQSTGTEFDSDKEFITNTTEFVEEKGGGCLIATATFDSELAKPVQQLRKLRDNKLLKTQSGTSFMIGFNSIYYLFSPTIADLEREFPIFREIVKITITPLLTTLSILNYVDLDSEIKIIGYGLTIILLNVGIYFIIPAVLFNELATKMRDRQNVSKNKMKKIINDK